MENLNNIYHFEQITPQIGCSGQPTAEQFALIAQDGFSAVINLAMADSDNAIANEGSIVTHLGMTYVHIPVDFANPTLDNLHRFVGIMQALEKTNGGKVWVHCVVNARVSAFLYLYLKHIKGLPENQCRTVLLDRWESQMDEVWSTFLKTSQQSILSVISS